MTIYDSMRHFLSSIKRALNINVVLNTINHEDRLISVDAFPLGINYKAFKKAIKDPRSEGKHLGLEGG